MMGATLREKFEERYEPEPNSGCWLWTAGMRGGYGRLVVDGRKLHAHSVAYRLFKGEPPEGTEIDHLCRVRACVNPQHLEAVSHRTNVLRGVGLAAMQIRRTRCPYGHEYVVIRRSSGRVRRDCRECHRAAYHRRMARLSPEEHEELRQRLNAACRRYYRRHRARP